MSLADLTTTALPDGGASRTPFLQDLTANGNRVYFTYGGTTDEDQHVTRALSWADRDLTAAHDVDPVGDVLATAISKAGSTRGLAYIVVLTRAGMQRAPSRSGDRGPRPAVETPRGRRKPSGTGARRPRGPQRLRTTRIFTIPETDLL